MIILAIKTDSQDAELILFDEEKMLAQKSWAAGRGMAKELPSAISNFLAQQKIENVDGYVGYLGPGSFTGLRIGLSVINALAYAHNKLIVGAQGDEWANSGVKRLLNNENDKILIPLYGADANITPQKK